MGLFSPKQRWTCPECGDWFDEKYDTCASSRGEYFCSEYCLDKALGKREKEEVNRLVFQGFTREEAWAELNRRAIEASRKRHG